MPTFKLTSEGRRQFRNYMFKTNFTALVVLFAGAAIGSYYLVDSPTRWYLVIGGSVMLAMYAVHIVRSRFDLWRLELDDRSVAIFAGESEHTVKCRAKMERSQVVAIEESAKGLWLLAHTPPYGLRIPAGIEGYQELRSELENWTPIRLQ